MKKRIIAITLICMAIFATGCSAKESSVKTPEKNTSSSSTSSTVSSDSTTETTNTKDSNLDIATNIIIKKLNAKSVENAGYSTEKFGSVTIKCEGTDKDGKYIVAVRSFKNTEVVKWYHVDVSAGEKQAFYEEYYNTRFGFTIEYPDTFVAKPLPDNGDGIIYSAPDGSAELTVSGINNVNKETVTSIYNNLLKEHSNASYKKQENNWMVVSWLEGDNIIYEKSVAGSGSINTFILKYSSKEKDYYSSIVSHINASFKTPTIDASH